MKVRFDGYNWLVRLRKGEMLMESLTEIAKNEKMAAAWITGLGAARWVELGYYDLEGQKYHWKKLEKLEVTSLQGNIGWDGPPDGGKPVLHIHGSFSDVNMQGFGGHIKDLEVAGTLELLLHRWYSDSLERKLDEETGLKLLDL